MATVIETGGSGGGTTISSIADVPALTETLAIDGVFTFPNSGKVGSGWIKYANITIPENSKADIDFQADGTHTIVRTAGFGIVVDTAGKVNVYKDGTDIKIQNKTGAIVVITYWVEAK